MDLEVEVAVKRASINDQTELIKDVDEKSSNKTDQLFRLGYQVTKERFVNQTCQQIITAKEQTKTDQIETKLKQELQPNMMHHNLTKKLLKMLHAKDFKITLKFLLPKLAPNEKCQNTTLVQKHQLVSSDLGLILTL